MKNYKVSCSKCRVGMTHKIIKGIETYICPICNSKLTLKETKENVKFTETKDFTEL